MFSDSNVKPPRDISIFMIDKKLLEILVCPISKMPLQLSKEKNELISREAGLAFPIRDGIPVMLETEARKLEKEELSAND